MKQLFSIDEACKQMGIGRTKLRELVAQRELEACKIGRRTLITAESIKELISRGIQEAEAIWPTEEGVFYRA